MVPSSVGNPSLAIGVCTFNRGADIVRTLAAIAQMDDAGGRLRQTLVINNASTDDTPEHVARFLAEHPAARIRFVHEPTPGKVAALRRFLAETQDPYVGILDDDTVPEARWAVAMLSILDEEPRAGVAGGPVHNIWESGPTRLARIYRRSLGDQLLGEQRLRLDDPGRFLMGASTVYRRAAIAESGWPDAATLECLRGRAMACGEDAELCLLIRRCGWQVWYTPDARCGHLIPPWRQTPRYLAALRRSICRSEPRLAWLSAEAPTRRWAEIQFARARRLHLKTLLTDWRPTRRRIRLAERRGRVAGWADVLAAHPG